MAPKKRSAPAPSSRSKRASAKASTSEQSASEREDVEVEHILERSRINRPTKGRKRMVQAVYWYKIKFVGFDEPEWVQEEDLGGCKELVESFVASLTENDPRDMIEAAVAGSDGDDVVEVSAEVVSDEEEDARRRKGTPDPNRPAWMSSDDEVEEPRGYAAARPQQLTPSKYDFEDYLGKDPHHEHAAGRCTKERRRGALDSAPAGLKLGEQGRLESDEWNEDNEGFGSPDSDYFDDSEATTSGDEGKDDLETLEYPDEKQAATMRDEAAHEETYLGNEQAGEDVDALAADLVDKSAAYPTARYLPALTGRSESPTSGARHTRLLLITEKRERFLANQAKKASSPAEHVRRRQQP